MSDNSLTRRRAQVALVVGVAAIKAAISLQCLRVRVCVYV